MEICKLRDSTFIVRRIHNVPNSNIDVQPIESHEVKSDLDLDQTKH